MGKRPRLPPPNCFMSWRDASNCLMRRFTSATCVPLPAAIRLRREPLRISGRERSRIVIEQMIASTRATSRSSISIFGIARERPGIIFMISLNDPILRTWRICVRKSSSVNSDFRSFFAMSSACCSE